jgi:hypothetical protein
MKTNLYLALLLCFAVIRTSAQQSPSTLKSNSKIDLPVSATDDWFSNASAEINRMEYSFSQTKNQNYRVANSATHLGFQVSPVGYDVQAIKVRAGQQSWNVNFQVSGISKNLLPVNTLPSFTPVSKGSNLRFNSASADVEYINGTDGLRQNFIVKEKPSGDAALRVNLKISTSLAYSCNQNRLSFYTASNRKDVKMSYEDLKAWDANGNALAAHMELKANLLSLVVDDKNATYPVTIDPLNKTPDWSTSADGILPGLLTNLQLQVQTLYGYTVAGLGDINGDGYDDVAVSAPGMADVIVNPSGPLVGVGAVFVYLGSVTGLPTTPSKVLQPNTAVEGSLFGYSIDAGDITGDGKNDIVIGAPMDRYTTSAAALTGSVSVSVTAGKVYIYKSEDLLVSPNPTNFLELKLQGTAFFVHNILASNITENALFGFSVAVTDDINNDSKADIVIGSPTYVGIDVLSVQSGAAFVFYSNNLATTAPVELDVPTPTLLGLPLLPLANTSGLLFGYSVDGVGDYNSDGKPDIAVGAPAGVDLTSGIFSGQILGGSVYVYYGKGNGVKNNVGCRLQADATGLLSNAANLFGYKVKGVRNIVGNHTGNILVGAPTGSLIPSAIPSLTVKAGQVHLFAKKNNPSSPQVSTQIISSPRASSILSILSLQPINVSLMFGSSIDNMLDVNCDGIADIIVGEPLSTAVPFLGADVVGGAAYVYLGKSDGTYETAPFWTLNSVVSPILGVNTTALLGYSVAGARYVKGRAQGVRSLVGGPSNTLDFGIGLLNLGNTLGTTFSFAFDNNGLGKAYTFPYLSCNITLPANLLVFDKEIKDKSVLLDWTTASEEQLNFYELQRSTDGLNFENIAVVFPKGEVRNDYKYTDTRPAMGANYYRLRIVDNDGRFKYSQVLIANFNQQLPADVIVAPNPVVGSTINVRLIGLEKGQYKIELRTTGGQLVQTKSVRISQHDQSELMSRSANMAGGMYWLSVYDASQQRVKTMRVFMTNE